MSKKKYNDVAPNHYTEQKFDTALVMEEIFLQVLNSDDDSLGGEREKKVAAKWISFALKHIIRSGKKDTIKSNLIKAREYLKKALYGYFTKSKKRVDNDYSKHFVQNILDLHQDYVNGEISNDEWEQGQAQFTLELEQKLKGG